jgi:Protein of unknown function (DUF4235)
VVEEKVWNGVASGAAVVAVAATAADRAGLAGGPGVGAARQPGPPDVSWRDALLWAVITGALVGVIRVVAQRLAAAAWQGMTGNRPEALAATRP